MSSQADERLTQRLVLNPHLKVVHVSDDEVVVKHGARSPFSRIIQDEGRTRLLGRVLRNMMTPTTLSELGDRGLIRDDETEQAVELIDYLSDAHVLVDPAHDATRVYLDAILGGGTPLSDLTAGLVGAGYLGSRIAGHLAGLGLGRLIAWDDRQVEEESVDRRYFNLTPSAVQRGRPYLECLHEHLTGVGYEGFEPIVSGGTEGSGPEQVFARAQFVIAASEVFSSKSFHALNEMALEHTTPWMTIYADGSEIFIGPIFVPGETCCYNEFELQHEASSFGVKDEYLVYKEALDDGVINASHLVLTPYLDTAAGIGVVGLLRFLLSGRSFVVGRCIRFDFERLSVDYEEVLRLPRCPACNPYRPHRHLFL